MSVPEGHRAGVVAMAGWVLMQVPTVEVVVMSPLKPPVWRFQRLASLKQRLGPEPELELQLPVFHTGQNCRRWWLRAAAHQEP